jgi:hypothetical protein
VSARKRFSARRLDMAEEEQGVNKVLFVRDPETDESLPLEKGFEYAAAITKFHQTECSHPATSPIRVKIAGDQFRCGIAALIAETEWVLRYHRKIGRG